MVILPSIRRKYMVNRIPRGATVPVSDCVVALATDKAMYTGSARTVGVSVSWEGTALVVNEDYTLSFANNVNLGPATVTVTGMGQFSGSVTKTFFIVSGSILPWGFDITKTEYVGASSCNTNGGYVLAGCFNENYDGNGTGFVPAAFGFNNSWLRGFSFSRDENGEFHVENMNWASPVSVDGVASGNWRIPVLVSPDGKRSIWTNDVERDTPVLKQKSGSVAFDLSGMSWGADSPDIKDYIDYSNTLMHTMTFFSGNGKFLYVAQASWNVVRFTLATPFDVSTIDTGSASVQKFLDVSNTTKVVGAIFNSDGSQALVSTNWNYKFYHVGLSSPYDLGTATEIGVKGLSHASKSFCITNNGKTLLVGSGNGLYEYSLSA